VSKTKIMMLSLTSTLLLINDDIDDADDANDADDADDVNDANDADVDDADDERRRRSSIEERKKSRLDTSLDRVERLVMCCFFASLAVNQAKSRMVVGLGFGQKFSPNPWVWVRSGWVFK
jgi:hypothetical protein